MLFFCKVYRRPSQPVQARRANRAGKPGKRARPGEASQSGKPANQARRGEPIRQASQARRHEPIRQGSQPGQVSSDIVIWRIPAHTLAHTLLIYGVRFVGTGRPGHPGHPPGRPNEARQVASQLAAARPEKADEAAGREQAGQPRPAGQQATRAPGRHPGQAAPASQSDAQNSILYYTCRKRNSSRPPKLQNTICSYPGGSNSRFSIS